MMDDSLRSKVITEFKGFIRTHKLVPHNKELRLFNDAEYERTLKIFESDKETFELFYKRPPYFRLLDLVARFFPDQTDNKFVSECLTEAITEWIEGCYDINDQTHLEQAAIDFLKRVEQNIHTSIVLIPIEGLIYERQNELQLAQCQLCCNSSDSDLKKAIRQNKETTLITQPSLERMSAFFRVKLAGHFHRTIQNSKDEVELSLNVLRLFIGSYYFDIYRQRSSPKFMGIMGTLHSERSESNVFLIQPDMPIEEQNPGFLEQYAYRKSFKLNEKTWKTLENSKILQRINQVLCSMQMDKLGISGRLLRALGWFGKASKAGNIVESYLMYAIAVESLLSEGRTSKETYAKRIAALTTRNSNKGIYPQGGHISPEFGEKLEKTMGSDRFIVVRDRVETLFNYRNDIAHGMVLGDEIESLNLLDLETLVRNAILSFIDGNWDSLNQFTVWMKENALDK